MKQEFLAGPHDERGVIEPFKLGVKKLVGRFGFEVRPIVSIPEASVEDRRAIDAVKPYTMTSVERLWSTLISVRYVARNMIPGAFVECGVWRGGQAALAARTFSAENERRDIWLFDTFAGMTAPTDIDVNVFGQPSAETHRRSQKGAINTWAYASLDEVAATMAATGYPKELLHFVQGPVEQTLRSVALPEQIAILRLDTDWYESTRDEMELLYPRVSSGGILMIDDYGHYAGARRAVDEYFASKGLHPLLQPIDYSARLFVRP